MKLHAPSLFAVFLAAAASFSALGAEKKTILMLAGKPSHGPGQHEHNAGILVLAKCLREGAADRTEVITHLNAEWPSAEELAKADTLVVYSDGGGGHPLVQGDHLAQLGKEIARGCGLVCLHYAVEPAFEKVGWPEASLGADGKPLPQEPPAGRSSKGPGSAEFRDWLGGYFEQFWSVNPHWTADFTALPQHPITRGVQPFSTNDEWYYHMRFREGMRGVTPILSALPTAETLNRGTGSHSGNPDVRRAVLEEKQPQHVAWAAEGDRGNRGFGFTGGHYHKGWGNADQRKLVLNAILWTAKADVPASGVESKVSEEELAANLDPKPAK